MFAFMLTAIIYVCGLVASFFILSDGDVSPISWKAWLAIALWPLALVGLAVVLVRDRFVK